MQAWRNRHTHKVKSEFDPNVYYTSTKTTVSMIHYHFVFCPRYRRKIFLIKGVEDMFKQLTINECQWRNIQILAMECHKDHVHLFVKCLPTQSPQDVMKWIKDPSSKILRDTFPQLSKMPSLWTRSYFVSTAWNVSSAIIKNYIDTQKTRP